MRIDLKYVDLRPKSIEWVKTLQLLALQFRFDTGVFQKLLKLYYPNLVMFVDTLWIALAALITSNPIQFIF